MKGGFVKWSLIKWGTVITPVPPQVCYGNCRITNKKSYSVYVYTQFYFCKSIKKMLHTCFNMNKV